MMYYHTALGNIERTKRPDGKLNVWRYQFLFNDDHSPRWVLIGVVSNAKSKRH